VHESVGGKADIPTTRCGVEFVDGTGGNSAGKSISLLIAVFSAALASMMQSLERA